MQDPYLILGLLEHKANGTVDDATVKSAYLELLRCYPPEREPLHFQQIRKAYENLATRQKRVQYSLFDLTLPDRQDLACVLLPQKPLSRPSLKQAQDLLGQP